MIGLDQLVGHASARRELARMLEHDRVPQALLFQGPERVGKATAARAFARSLLCSATPRGCGRCDDCHLVERGSHPDLMCVERLPKKESAGRSGADSGSVEDADLASFIVVDQIRELTHYAGLSPRQGARRVFLIDPADRMNAAAQNALLKTLEEPAPTTVMLLVTARPFLLLPTVRSRCYSVRFSPLGSREVSELLERHGLAPAEARLRAALAAGRPGVALALDVEALGQRREEVLAALERLAAGPAAVAELPGLAAQLAGKDEGTTSEHLDLLQSLLRDAARAAVQEREGLLHVDLAPRLERLGRSLGPTHAARLVGSIDRLRGEMRFNLNRLLILESVLAAVAGAPLP